MKFIITESQYRNLFLEERKPKEIEGCGVFKNMDHREFCKTVQDEISSNLDEYSPKMENLLKNYFLSDEKISEIQMDVLTKESKLVTDGFKDIENVENKLLRNCPTAKENATRLKDKWLSKYNVYFKDVNGDYHLLNRLDTNYTAQAVLITFFYLKLINQVRKWTGRKTTPSSFFVNDWIEHFFDPKVKLIDPRIDWKDDLTKTQTELVEPPNHTYLFNQVLKPQEFIVEESNYHDDFMKTLKQVRDKGFKTEDLFEQKLKDYGIEYERYSYDYSFVDMVLGIDFLIKQMKGGEDYWVPVQVKSHFKEPFSLVDSFKCTKVIKPRLEKINGEDDFMIGDIRGFKEYFCEEHNYCKRKEEKKKVYAPSSLDYFSSKEYNN